LIGQTGSDFVLGGNLSVNDFSFDNNSKLLLGDHDLIVNGKIFNYGPTSYFVTNGSGKLQINNIGNVETVFPVGPSISSYNPAGITNAGTADNFRVNIQSQVLSGGTTGSPYVSGIVNRTWNVDESTAGASDVALTLQWNAEDELTGFTRSASYLSHYISGAWDNGIQMSASGSNPFSITRTHINSFSPFAVMGASALVPVSLLDFKGNYKERAISLDWITETELNTGYFTVEKSIDAVYFKPLTNIPASGNSQGRNNYHYVDHTFLNSINYYRLKIVDFDGRSVYSKIITVTTPADHKFVVFPNPVKDKLYIPLQIRATETVLRVVDTKGRTVRTFKLKAGTAGTSINIADLPAGIYLLLLDAGKLKETLQFIKQ
jgi:Secretion system C-terminal sorting domain